MDHNTNNLTALFKENIAEFCSIQEALYYILLGVVPFGDSRTFKQNVNKVLILKHSFPNNPYLEYGHLRADQEIIRPDLLDSITLKCDKYCIELEKLSQSASNDLRELLLNGMIKAYHAESRNLISKDRIQELKINFRYWENDDNIVVNFNDLSEVFPIEKIHKPKHYKIINNGLQLIILDDITSKRSEAKIKKNKEKISTIAKNDVIIPMYIKLSEEEKESTESDKTKQIRKDLNNLASSLCQINPIYVYPLIPSQKPAETVPPNREKDILIQNVANRYQINAQHLEDVIRKYYDTCGNTRYDTLCRWCRNFENQKKS